MEDQNIINNLDYLETYFYAGSAESETSFLKDIFVPTNDFVEIIKPRGNTIQIVVGNKGSGKSALLEYLLQRSRDQSIPVVRITPDVLENISFGENTSPAIVISGIRKSILKAMAIEAGKNLSGSDLLNVSENNLFREAIEAGEAQSSITDKALKVLMPIGKAITKIDFKQMLPDQNITSASRVTDLSNYMNDKKVFYVLLDDVDQICNASRSDYLDIIWSEILAVLKIAQELPFVYPIISVRKEIWRKLSIDGGNRDKYDQIRNMVYHLSPSRDELKAILEQRLLKCKEKNKLSGTGTYAPFFYGKDCKLPNSNDRRLWPDYLISSSRENPRDVIQLVYTLIDNACKKSRSLINDSDVEDTALAYSKERVSDLTKQNKDLCPDLEAVIRSFARINFQSPAQDVRNHLCNVPGQGNIKISGKTLRVNNIDDAFLTWDLLYNIGFINPQTPDNTQTKNYSFLEYDSTLVTLARWNDMQKYSWHVHPCYRSYLIDLKAQEKKRILIKEEIDSTRTTSGQNMRRR